MDDELTGIHNLIGALSDLRWQRATKPGVSAFEVIFENVFVPSGSEELAIWLKLTSPENYKSLQQYVVYWQARGVNEYAEKLDQQLLTEATSRWEAWKAVCGNEG